MGNSGYSQVICIQCFNQNDPMTSGENNLMLNGDFEDTDCFPGSGICPISFNYACDFENWTVTGGGSSTYAQAAGVNIFGIAEGSFAVYFGNWFCSPCSVPDDTSCIVMNDCIVEGIPEGFPEHWDPTNYGSNGLAIEQTVSGLTIGMTYTLEFWTGGEDFSAFPNPGVFGLDIGFGEMTLTNPAVDPGEIGRRYLITFTANATSHTFKWINWGLICSSCTELVLDDVRLYEGSSSEPSFTLEPVGIEGCSLTIQTTNNSMSSDVTYFWDMGDGTTYTTAEPEHTYAEPGTYTVTLSIEGGCGVGSSTQEITVSVPSPIEASFEFFQEECDSRNLTLTNTSIAPEGVSISWDMGDGTTLDGPLESYTYTDLGTYTITLVVEDEICNVSDTFTEEVVVEETIDISSILVAPNVFSPNGDGVNDTFFPIDFVADYVTLRVWNRWGGIVYESAGSYKPWNGKNDSQNMVPDGVYFYTLIYDIPCNGKEFEGVISGYVHLMDGGK
jgi:gliding motility-associated-like protein